MIIISYVKRVIGNFAYELLKRFGPDKIYLGFVYKTRFGYWPSFKHPKTFNEKIQCLKLYDHNPLYTVCADKYLVRNYVKDKIGEQYLVKLYHVFKSPEDIDLSILPDKFVLKLNTGSKGNIICHDKSVINEAEIKEFFREFYNQEFYKRYREYHYKNIRKTIICEQLLVNDNGQPLFDYKFFCFNGEPYIIMVELGESFGGKRNIYNVDWSRHRGYITNPQDYEYEVPQPDNYEEMLDVVRALSAGFKHVRVDLYLVNGLIYFGELTFTSAGGFLPFSDYEFDLEMGEKF